MTAWFLCLSSPGGFEKRILSSEILNQVFMSCLHEILKVELVSGKSRVSVQQHAKLLNGFDEIGFEGLDPKLSDRFTFSS
jgi:hypothetical protein